MLSYLIFFKFAVTRVTLKMLANVRVMEHTSAVFVNVLQIISVVDASVMQKIWAFMVILKPDADLTIPRQLFVTSEEIVFVENVNAIQEKIH